MSPKPKHPAAAEGVAAISRLLAEARLVEGFGHVSARAGEDMVITSTTPLGATTATDTITMPIAEAAFGKPEWATGSPLEVSMHAAIYLARPELNGICRTHSAAVAAIGARNEVPPLLHGLAGQAGELALIDYPDLAIDKPSGEQIADALGPADCLIVRTNGALATGTSLARSAVRAWYLEDRCRVAIEAGSNAVPFTEAELGARSKWFDAETVRAWSWLNWRFGNSVELEL